MYYITKLFFSLISSLSIFFYCFLPTIEPIIDPTNAFQGDNESIINLLEILSGGGMQLQQENMGRTATSCCASSMLSGRAYIVAMAITSSTDAW
jgi:hypothetical protein